MSQTVMIYLLGLLGLNIIVFVHELGHFLLARAVGINVEVFSIGMGPKIWKKQFKTFEFALSALPLGGYCKMQGETMVANSNEPPKVGDMYYGHPWRRLVAVVAGAGFNFIFAYIVFVIVGMMSTEQIRMDNRIFVQASAMELVEPLQNGDIILAINDKATPYFADIEQTVFTSAGKNLQFKIQRGGAIFTVEKYIEIDRISGVGLLPILPYIDTTIASILPHSAAEQAGLQAGDTIIAINQTPVETFYHINAILSQQEKDASIELSVIPTHSYTAVTTNITLQDGKLGIQAVQSQKVVGLSFPKALKAGVETFSTTLSNYVHGLTLLITNKINMKESLSGPIQTTELIGSVAKSSPERGIHDILLLLGILSLIIGFMNLLPIPLLDGGLILLFLIEVARGGKPLSALFLRIYQFLGMAFILLLLFLAISSDISYLFRRM